MTVADTPEGPRLALPRRARTILGGLGMVLLFGILGLAW